MVIVCLHDLLSLAKKVCIVLNHNRLDAGWQLCVVLLLGMLCIWRRFPCSAGVERADMRMGGRNSGFKYGNGTVVTGFPIVERWSCYRSLPTRYRMYGILVCRINQVMEGTTAGRSERCAHGCCNPSGGGTYFIMLFQNWGMLFVRAAFVTDSSSIKRSVRSVYHCHRRIALVRLSAWLVIRQFGLL